MRNRIAFGLLLAMAFAVPAAAGTSVRIGVGINGPPPVVYRHEPRWVMYPEERVYVVDDDALGYDYFRYGGWYWIYDNDRWYHARRYNGPFMAVRGEYVPEPIWRMGGRYHWRHQPAALPPGLARKYERTGGVPPGWARRDGGGPQRGQGGPPGDDRGRGRGHDKGHGHEDH
jgi:hypothetical protein